MSPFTLKPSSQVGKLLTCTAWSPNDNFLDIFLHLSSLCLSREALFFDLVVSYVRFSAFY